MVPVRLPVSRILSAHYLESRETVLGLLLVLATLLEVAAAVGLSFVAGFGRVRAVLAAFDGRWLLALAGALLLSFIGYYYAYRGIFRVEGGPRLPRRQ